MRTYTWKIKSTNNAMTGINIIFSQNNDDENNMTCCNNNTNVSFIEMITNQSFHASLLLKHLKQGKVNLRDVYQRGLEEIDRKYSYMSAGTHLICRGKDPLR